MVFVEADNILSPLGDTTEANYQAVRSGQSVLCEHTDELGLMERYCASLFTPDQRRSMATAGLTDFEAMIVASVRKALASTDIPIASRRTLLVVSSTKGNVGLLSPDTTDNPRLADSAVRIAATLGLSTTPITVCNACVSGLSAIIVATRLMECGFYDHAIVAGADCQSRFIVSGFQSLKALSPSPCRPFDMERTGLNLGEAASTIVLSRCANNPKAWAISRCAAHNDAYHATTPSKTGEGLYRCLSDVLSEESVEALAQVNAHGTATLFNDQMEAVVLSRAGLQHVPVNALKGYFGHTMGAAGILETILTMHALDHHEVIATRGFEELGVSKTIAVAPRNLHTDKRSFLKTISGFGGCNAAVLATRLTDTSESNRLSAGNTINEAPQLQTEHWVSITPEGAAVDGQQREVAATGPSLLTSLYKSMQCDYPKFYKMDALSRLAFVAAELLLQAEGSSTDDACEKRAVILFNRSSSIVADRHYLASIADAENYFPSPSVFVYTLPNLTTGEIAMRHGYHGETSFYILPHQSDELQSAIVSATLARSSATSALTGWIDYETDDRFEAKLQLVRS